MIVPRPRSLARVWAVGALMLAGCTEGTSLLVDSAPFEVRVQNAGAAELRDVVVHVSNTDSIRVGRLAPGGATALAAVSVVHETPAVRATVAGQLRALIPVEGFDGFNPPRPPGRYTITIAAGAGEHELGVTIRRD
jgi:hypothetical protein